MNNYVNLGIKSYYSFLQSVVKPENLLKYAKENQIKTLALADVNVMHGTLKFNDMCKKAGIKPLIGLTIDYHNEDMEKDRLILYAKNSSGYIALMKISTQISQSEKNILTFSDIKKYSSDLVVITSPDPKYSLFCKLIVQDEQLAVNYINELKKAVNDDLYVGIKLDNDYDIEFIAPTISEFATKNSLNQLLVPDTKYVYANESIYLDYFNAISSGKNLIEQQQCYYYKNLSEYKNIDNYKDAINNTLVIANKISDEVIPKNFENSLIYPLDKYEGATSKTLLLALCEKGLKRRLLLDGVEDGTSYFKRLEYELSVINKMGYADYFLFVWDFVKYAKHQEILVGPGRGSAAGSLVAYVLGITDIDPLKYDLLFERFLNPERVSMPDIDLDFPDNKRDEIIKYVHQKYGEKCVAQIITFNKYLIKNSIRDIAKVHNIPNKNITMLTSFFGDYSKKIDEVIAENRNLAELIKKYPEFDRILKVAKWFDGIPRHSSVHAAGVIISGVDLTNYTPLIKGNTEVLTTQYEAYDLEKIGLLKFDFLSIKNLTMLKQMEQIIKQDRDKFKLSLIPMEDKRTLAKLSSGQTLGIFQLESIGIRKMIQKLKITNFMDLALALAMYRPGPMNNVYELANRKNGRKQINYPHDDLKPVLEKTYGIIVYQEQVMQILQIIGGYSLGQADILRRAISKKQRDVIMNEQKVFVQKAVSKNYDKVMATKIYEDIVRFADYGFNLSHAVSYGKVAYQMAFIKAHFPTHFWIILLNHFKSDHKKISMYMQEMRYVNIKVLPPKIESSDMMYSKNGANIMMGLSSIKMVNQQIANLIIEARSKKAFVSFDDFVIRLGKQIKKDVIHNLIDAGVFDSFESNRKQLYQKYEVVVQNIDFAAGDLFGESTVNLKMMNDFTNEEKAKRQEDVIGVRL